MAQLFNGSTSLGRVRTVRRPAPAPTIKRLLIIVDDRIEQRRLAIEADAAGFDTHFATSSAEAMSSREADWEPDAIVLDQLLPRAEQYATIRRLRSAFGVPLLVASDEIGTQEAPFDRSVVMLSRTSLISEARHVRDEIADEPRTATTGALTLDLDRGEAEAYGRTIVLAPEEAAALRLLMQHAGEYVTRQTLLSAVIQAHRDLDPRIIDVYLVRLMVKLESATPFRVTRSQHFDAYRLELPG
jgi:DNA-binding response OmpR family regulator